MLAARYFAHIAATAGCYGPRRPLGAQTRGVHALEPERLGLGLFSRKPDLPKRSATLCHDEKGYPSLLATATLSY